MEHQGFYEGLFTTMQRSERQYAPNGSNYHDHLCSCPGCNYDGPEPTEEEIQQMDTVEVAIGQGKTVTIYREDGAILLENPDSAFFLDKEEAYRLVSLLEAEFKGVQS